MCVGVVAQVTGKGFEDVADIGRDVATLEFMGIDNIHVVRDSLAAFSAACHAPGQDYHQAIGASGWLKHLAQVRVGCPSPMLFFPYGMLL